MRPGVSNQIITPQEAVDLVTKHFKDKSYTEVVVGIAGPGESLYNDGTFKSLELIHSKYPEAQLCLCTNGLLLEKYAQRLYTLGIRYVTVTINAISPMIGKNIYKWINFNQKKYTGIEAAKILAEKQLAGLRKCIKLGIITKVNSVLIPNINDFHLIEISRRLKELGVYIHNIMPLIPLAELSHVPAPTCDLLRNVRNQSAQIMPIFRLCKQCRADACSIPGLE